MSLLKCHWQLSGQLRPYRLSHRLQTSTHEGIIQLQELAAGSSRGTSGYIYLQRATQCSRRRPWAVALFSFQDTDLPKFLVASTEQSPFLSNQSEAFCSWLTCCWKKRAGVMQACLHPYTSKSIEGLSCLPQKAPVPSIKPSARSVRGAPCEASELWDESWLSMSDRKSVWEHLLEEFLLRSACLLPESLHDLLWPGKCTWQAATMPAQPALLFLRRCKVSIVTTFTLLVLVPPCWTGF